MSNYEEAVERLLEVIKKHDSVIEFQKAEEKIKDFPELEELIKDMKAYQQEAVLFHKIDKAHAEKKLVSKLTSCKKNYQTFQLSKIIVQKCRMPVT